MPAAVRTARSDWSALPWSGGAELRSAVLRLQAELFAGAPARDAQVVATFEALALGLLPALNDDDAATVARTLAPVPETPASVIAALRARGGTVAEALEPAQRPARLDAAPDMTALIEDLLDLDDPDVDLAVALRPAANLTGAQLERLVARARTCPNLAAALLGRSDLAAVDEAALYVHADPARRERIRARLADDPFLPREGALPRADDAAATELVRLAGRQDSSGFAAALADALGLAAEPGFRFAEAGREDLLALALAAAGVPSDEAILVFLTLEPRIARSVPLVFGLAALARTVDRRVAARIVEATLDVSLAPARPGRHLPAAAPGGVPARRGALAGASSVAPADRAEASRRRG